jgi:hypothetical protein
LALLNDVPILARFDDEYECDVFQGADFV